MDTQELVVRDKENPILERDTIAGYDTLFNPGGIRRGDRLVLAVRAARHDRWLAAVTERSRIYTGQIYFNGVDTYYLAENIDDKTHLVIDGVTYINDTAWSVPSGSGPIYLP